MLVAHQVQGLLDVPSWDAQQGCPVDEAAGGFLVVKYDN